MSLSLKPGCHVVYTRSCVTLLMQPYRKVYTHPHVTLNKARLTCLYLIRSHFGNKAMLQCLHTFVCTVNKAMLLCRLQTFVGHVVHRIHDAVSSAYRGFPIRMVYLYYRSYLRYTILVGNPRYIHVLVLLKPCSHVVHKYLCVMLLLKPFCPGVDTHSYFVFLMKPC